MIRPRRSTTWRLRALRLASRLAFAGRPAGIAPEFSPRRGRFPIVRRHGDISTDSVNNSQSVWITSTVNHRVPAVALIDSPTSPPLGRSELH